MGGDKELFNKDKFGKSGEEKYGEQEREIEEKGVKGLNEKILSGELQHKNITTGSTGF